jgi:hypothetical protein
MREAFHHRMCRGIALLTTLLSVLSACATTSARRCNAARDSGELQRLTGTADSASVALRTVTDSQAVPLRQYLQAVVDRAAELDACGRITSPQDLRAAAQVGMSAGALGAETLERAYRWSRRAVVADTADRASWRLLAKSWDQLQLVQNQPQWFGTVVRCTDTTPVRCALAPIDTTRVTDPQRVELGLRTLMQQRERADSLSRVRSRP